ncbi:unnamed protein product [Caenorhabditis angaria]|uniref:CCHC-type domain-containing protein n=1 Tax=Caenorhabditis angaria TaxID=860376 RepID=A0A9P1IKF7_9PELO|nr:unnamed protein product [Caenorhabditis angaria]
MSHSAFDRSSSSSSSQSDPNRIDHNIRHYFQVFEKEIVRRIQESEERLRREIEETSMSKMDKIIDLITSIKSNYFDTSDRIVKQGDQIQRAIHELEQLKYMSNMQGPIMNLNHNHNQMPLPVPMPIMKQELDYLQEQDYDLRSQQVRSSRRSRSPRHRHDRSRSPQFIQSRDNPHRILKEDPRVTGESKPQGSGNKCIYCHYAHFSDECPIVSDVMKRKDILRAESRCFRCCGKLENHNNCASRECRYCKIIGKTRIDHHSSICRVPINTSASGRGDEYR